MEPAPRYCQQFFLLGNCTHPADCKDFRHQVEEEKIEEPQESNQSVSEKDSKTFGDKGLAGMDWVIQDVPNKNTTSSGQSNEITKTSEDPKKDLEDKKPKKKLQLKKDNSFVPSFTPQTDDLKLTSQKSTDSKTSIPNLSKDPSITAEELAFIEETFGNINQNDEYPDDQDYGYYNQNNYYPDGYDDQEEDNVDPGYYHIDSAGCECCHGYINNCQGGICENLGYCYCYAQELEEN